MMKIIRYGYDHDEDDNEEEEVEKAMGRRVYINVSVLLVTAAVRHATRARHDGGERAAPRMLLMLLMLMLKRHRPLQALSQGLWHVGVRNQRAYLHTTAADAIITTCEAVA